MTETALERNKRIVVDFYDKALNQKDAEAAIALMGDTYIQHNAQMADGKDGFRAAIAWLRATYPDWHNQILRVFAEGDFVILHVHLVREPGTLGDAVMDIFRLEDGKVVEHWDVLQPIPEQIAHTNTMF
jgi:predicted SnoaL-like aldol condensation-catalyzing enzyme